MSQFCLASDRKYTVNREAKDPNSNADSDARVNKLGSVMSYLQITSVVEFRFNSLCRKVEFV